MAENAVEHNADLALGRRLAQSGKILLRPKQRIDPAVIRRIVPMVGLRLKHRIEIEASHAQGGKRGELFEDPVQISAEKVVIEHFAVARGAPFRFAAPILPQNTSLRHGCPARARFTEPVREDLIDHAALEPLRCGKGGICHGELPILPFKSDLAQPVARMCHPRTAPIRVIFKMIPIQPFFRRRIFCAPPF